MFTKIKHNTLFWIIKIGYGISLVSIALCLLTSSSCEKKRFREIPMVYVNFYIYPQGIDNTLNTDGAYKYFDKFGYNGVFVYRLTSTEYIAFDRACPNDYEYGRFVTFDSKTFTLIDKEGCGTKFNLLTGYPERGELPNPLRRYNVSWVNGETLLVSN